MRKLALVAAMISGLIASQPAYSAAVVTSVNGADAGSISGAVDAFRTSLGVLNPNVVGSFGTGRREINWDGVPDGFADPNNLPLDFFNVNSPRGAVFSTPGTAVRVSANAGNPTGTPVRFSFSNDFTAFTSQRLFGVFGSNFVDVSFFVPGSNTPAFVSGFGSIFTDVELSNSTSIEFFGLGGGSLGVFGVLPGPNAGLSFLGVRFDGGEQVGRVRIRSGDVGLDACGIGGDCVAMDDFIFGEPNAVIAPVPEPATWLMLILGFGAVGAGMRRRSGDAKASRVQLTFD